MSADEQPFFDNVYPSQGNSAENNSGPFPLRLPFDDSPGFNEMEEEPDYSTANIPYTEPSQQDHPTDSQRPSVQMRSEDAQHNYSLLAQILDEPEKSSRLNTFYEHNKVLQGLNCFFMLDKQASRTPVTDNFTDDPNFSIGHFFDEKQKNQSDMFLSQSSSQNLEQQPPQLQTVNSYRFNQDSHEQSNAFNNTSGHQEQQQQHQQIAYQSTRDHIYDNPNSSSNNNRATIMPTQSHNNQQSNQHHHHHHHHNYGVNLSSMYCDDTSSTNHPSHSTQHTTHTNHNQSSQQNFNFVPHQGSRKSALQKQSASFLDKVTFMVDEFEDKQEADDDDSMSSGGENFLLRNLKNYIALELHQKEHETSYFQQFLNSSYQIFLQRLRLLIDQRRMDSRTLLPFVCRFSIDLAEKLLNFIYKCDDIFTMKIIRNDKNSKDFEQDTNFNQKFDTSIIDHHFSNLVLPTHILSNKHQASPHPEQSVFKNPSSLTPNEAQQHSQSTGPRRPETPSQQFSIRIEEEDDDEEDDFLPFPPSSTAGASGAINNHTSSSSEMSRKVQRKQWTKEELQVLRNLYREHQQKIPPSIMDELTRKLNRSIPSIQSKLQKMRRNTSAISSSSSSSHQIHSNSIKSTSLNNASHHDYYSESSQFNQQIHQNMSSPPLHLLPQHHHLPLSPQQMPTSSTSSVMNLAQQQPPLLKIEEKLKQCLFELPGQAGTKNQVLEKMREKFYSASCNNWQQNLQAQTSWEKSASQMLSSASFQKRRGVFKLSDDLSDEQLSVQMGIAGYANFSNNHTILTTSISTNKQKMLFVLTKLPERRGTLQEIVDCYLTHFTRDETEEKKLKENISKTLNSYDCFDKSHSKTIYFLTPVESKAIANELQLQQQQQLQQQATQNNNHSNNSTYLYREMKLLSSSVQEETNINSVYDDG